MKLNNIPLSTYNPKGNEVTFLLDCTLGAALSLDGQTLTVTSGERTVAIFDGYQVCGVETAGEYTRMTACRKLDEATAQAIEGLEAADAELGKQNDETAAVLAALLGGE